MTHKFTLNTYLDSYKPIFECTCDPEECAKLLGQAPDSFSILTQNIRSITCNFDNLRILLERTALPWDLLVLTECWLPAAGYIPDLKDYSYAITKTNATQNEGVVVYYRSTTCPVIGEPLFDDANCLTVQINPSTVIVAIYRPPGYKEPQKFIASLRTVLTNLKHFENIIITGDINIDITQNTNDQRSWDYLNLLAEYNIHPGHNIPTRNRTCLDHVMVKSEKVARCYIIQSSVTDHNSVAVSINLKKDFLSLDRTKIFIDQIGVDVAIKSIDFSPIYNMSDANDAAGFLSDQLTDAVKNNSKAIPIAKRKRLIKPWLTPGLLRCMKHRDKLHSRAESKPDDADLSMTFKRYRNFCNKVLKKTRRTYERKLIKKLWQQ